MNQQKLLPAQFCLQLSTMAPTTREAYVKYYANHKAGGWHGQETVPTRAETHQMH